MNPDNHVLEYVDAYLHDVLSPSDRGQVERHVESCRICQVALEEGRKRLTALQSLSVVEAPEELLRQTEMRIQAYRAPRWTAARIGIAMAVAALLVLGGMNLYYLNLAPSPYDLRVLGQAELLSGAEGSLRVVMVRHNDQTPVADVPVEVELVNLRGGAPVQLASFRTDQSGTGTPQFHWPDWDPGEYQLRVRAHSGSGGDAISRNVKLKRSWKLMVSSDKPVYQPGQVIHLRSLALRRPDLKPIAGHDALFSITDPKGNVIFRQRGVTSKFGISSTDCPLADEIIEGPYQVACEIGDTQSEMTVSVERYVLPKFKVSVELDKPFYQPGERVSGSVQSDYFFGKPVANGEVEVAINPGPFAFERIPPLGARTDLNGKAHFEFVLPDRLRGRDEEPGQVRVSLAITVRDTAGRQQTKTESCIVAAQPIQIDVVPEAGGLVDGIPNRIYLLARYPDGRPAQVRLSLSGQSQELATDELGVAVVDVEGHLRNRQLTVRATDREGRVGHGTFMLSGEDSPDDFLVRTDKATYRGGETLQLKILARGGSEPVFIDLIKDGQTMLTHVLPMSQGRGEGQFDLPAELFGTIELCAYRYGSNGLPNRKRRVLYVGQAHELHIDVTSGRPEYRPGERARLQLRLSGPDGKPVPGAISLAAVDEAVFSVLGQKPGLERTFFTLEQELLKPVLAAYPWVPGALPEIPVERRMRFEQALFARAAKDGESDHQASLRTPVRRMQNNRRARGVDERDDAVPLRSTASVHTLSATSFPAKLQAVHLQKSRGITLVRELAAGAALLGFAYVVVLAWRRFWMWILASFGVLALFSLMLLPAVQQPKTAVESAMAFAVGAKSEEGPGPDSDAATSENSSPRLRQWFPETLLWRPELITDDNGEVGIDVDLADSITTWRVSASAVSAQGDLGAAQSSVLVFQPFFVDLNLPVAFTRGDTVTVPVVVYNYLDRPQTVQLNLENAAAFELTGPAEQSVELAANEVKSVGYRLQARRVGKHTLRVAARAGAIADAVERTVEVVPDGQKTEQVASGNLAEAVRIPVEIPEQAIDGSVRATLKIYPSSFSQLVEGLEGIFQRPSGCFEQTSSTTYPNILALDYLIRTKKNVPDVGARARQYIHLGYQRLLTFEITGGGFEWFGHPPANRVLSAYGLMEFTDMARVHDVDRAVIERTRSWLLAQQNSNGTWESERHILHDDPTGGAGRLARLAATAYIAWAVFGGDSADRATLPAQQALDYLRSQDPATIDDPYVLALVANAVAAIDRSPGTAAGLLRRLDSLKQTTADGKRVWWEGNASAQTLFYGGGITRRVETTALASLAMLRSTGNYAATLRSALAWLVEQKDARGTWHSTQATVLALKALVAATERPLGDATDRQIDIAIDGTAMPVVVIPNDQADVMQQRDLSAKLGFGRHEVVIIDRSGGSMGYQLAVSYHTPGEPASAKPESFSVTLEFDKADMRVGDTVLATAVVRNNTQLPVAMVIVDLPIPTGFAADNAGLSQLVVDRRIEKFQITPRSVIIYLRSLAAGQSVTIPYKLRGTTSVDVTSGAAVAWEYYQPENSAHSAVARLVVSE